MNRILKRPMFRMGGSPQFEFQERTTGILSGLDGPKLNASRTGMVKNQDQINHRIKDEVYLLLRVKLKQTN